VITGTLNNHVIACPKVGRIYKENTVLEADICV